MDCTNGTVITVIFNSKEHADSVPINRLIALSVTDTGVTSCRSQALYPVIPSWRRQHERPSTQVCWAIQDDQDFRF